jgi:hypothetical protein
MDTTDRIVEIARFQYPAEAQTLMALLQSEGIDCYLRNEYSAYVMAGCADIGGAQVEILESAVPRAMEVMKAGGYELPGEDEDPRQAQAVGGWISRIPWIGKLSLEKQLCLCMALIALCLGLLIYLGTLFSDR